VGMLQFEQLSWKCKNL